MPTQDLPTQWRIQAADYLRIAKAYKGRCSSTEATRLGYVKTAAQLNDCADQLDRSLEEARGPQERASEGIPQVVLDSAVEGQAQAAADEGAAVQDVQASGPSDRGHSGGSHRASQWRRGEVLDEPAADAVRDPSQLGEAT